VSIRTLRTKVPTGDGIFITLDSGEEVRLFNNTGITLYVKVEDVNGRTDVVVEEFRERYE